MKYIKTAGLMFIYTCIFFILFSGDFYGDKTIIPVSILYFPLGFIFIWIILFFILRKREIKGVKRFFHIVIGLSIFISITQGVRWVADDILEDLYDRYLYKSLLSFPEYVQHRGNLFDVKLDLLKEGIYVENLYAGRGNLFNPENLSEGLIQDIKYKIYFDYKTNYYFIYNWDERKLTDKVLQSVLIEQVMFHFKVSKDQINFIQEIALDVVYDNNIQTYNIVPREGKILLIDDDGNKELEIN